MSLANNDRFNNMSRAYDAAAPVMVPMYGFLQTEAIRLLPFESQSAIVIADLGAGSGRLLERLLTRYPNAIGYYLDASQAFRTVAEKRLQAFSDRMHYVTGNLQENWQELFSRKPNVVISMSALHHLDAIEKKGLYQRCYAWLQPGGWLINIDEMKGFSPAAYRASLDFWVRHVETVVAPTDPELRAQYAAFKQHFANWRIRNVENYGKPKTTGDDLHDGFSDQLEWLEQIGFENVDCFVKYHLWCVVGGRKSNTLGTAKML